MPTSRRIHRISQTLHQRQLDIVIALDLVHDQHNLSAVLRTADAAGFGRVIWAPDFKKPEEVNPEVSKGAERWVDLKVVDDIKPSLTADENIFLPMAGFVQSLNISVAAAVTMYEIQRQRQQAGMYNRNASEDQVHLLYNQWRLVDEELTLDDLWKRPEGPLPPPDQPHKDGRADCPFFKRHHKGFNQQNNL